MCKPLQLLIICLLHCILQDMPDAAPAATCMILFVLARRDLRPAAEKKLPAKEQTFNDQITTNKRAWVPLEPCVGGASDLRCK